MTCYFTLNDKSNLANFDILPIILEPNHFYTCIDHVTKNMVQKIYQALYERNFNVADFDIEFSANTDDKLIRPSVIKHSDFIIRLYSSGTFEMLYPERHITFYTDSGAVLYTYAGTDWEEDKIDFFSIKMHAKLRNEKKTYLKYVLDDRDQFCFDKDDREYSPEEDEPEAIKKTVEFNKLKNYLEHVLDMIKQSPAIGFDKTIFDYKRTEIEPIKIVTFQNKYDKSDNIRPKNRLVPYLHDVSGPFKDLYHESFIYAETNQDKLESKTSFIGNVSMFDDLYRIEIELKYSDLVFVLDLTPSMNYKESAAGASKFNLFGDIIEKKEEDPIFGYYQSLVSRIVRLEDYDNSFENPVYLIGRIIREDEIKLVEKCGKQKTYSDKVLEK